MTDSTTPTLKELLTEFGNASFECGEHDDDDPEAKPYGVLMERADSARAALESFFSEGTSRWISVKERMPDRKAVITPAFPDVSADVVFCSGDAKFIGRYDFRDGSWWGNKYGYVAMVSHWMPLPEAQQ